MVPPLTPRDRASVALALALSAAGAVGLRSPLNRAYDARQTPLDEATIPRPTVARVISLGHTEWLAEVMWVNATLYYGDALFARSAARYIVTYADVMQALDPNFRLSYLWAANALVYRTHSVTKADVEASCTQLRRGLAVYPDDPELNLQMGFNLAFELAQHLPTGSPEKARARAEGAEFLRRASFLDVGPAWLPLTAATLLTEAGRRDAALDTLRDALVRVSDDSLRSRMEARIQTLVREHGEDDPVVRATRDSEAARRRSYPWIPPTFYLFVGEPML